MHPKIPSGGHFLSLAVNMKQLGDGDDDEEGATATMRLRWRPVNLWGLDAHVLCLRLTITCFSSRDVWS